MFLTGLPDVIAFLIAVLVTPKAKPAKVKVEYCLISPVIMFVISTGIPLITAPIVDNLTLVWSESITPVRAMEILVLACSVNKRPKAASAKLARVLSDVLRSLNFLKVSSVCLYPELLPAILNIFYSGFIRSI